MLTDNSNAVSVEVELDPRINLALQQNDVPVIKRICVLNGGDAPLQDLELVITAEPRFAEPCRIHIDSLPPASAFESLGADLKLSPSFFWNLNERLHGSLHVDLMVGDAVVSHQTFNVALLARDEWGGMSSLPEILAAFVLPNDPVVDEVLRDAAGILRDWTGDPTIDGYQRGDTERTFQIVAAIYASLQRLRLTYVSPPPSFESEGQRVRHPQRIRSSRMGTCLDLALLAAACAEQAGLHPVVFVVKGHAFTGVWLHDETLATPSSEDCQHFRKLFETKDLIPFDPTLVTRPDPVDFTWAIGEARRHLADDKRFVCAVDIQRSRVGQIRPIPHDQGDLEPPTEGFQPGQIGTAPFQGFGIGDNRGETGEVETPRSRVDRWRVKLLDLSLRNRLLNFQETKKTLRFACPDVAALEDRMASGQSMTIEPLPDDYDRGPRDAAVHRRREGADPGDLILLERMKANRLCARLTQSELQRRLTEIYRGAKISLEEGGANSLYLAIGFLSWFEAGHSKVTRRAPILLLPVEISRKSIREGYRIRRTDDDPQINVTLLEMLRRDHGITVTGIDPLPEDDSGLDVPRILMEFQRAVRDVERWEVIHEACLGMFTFAKYLLWHDLGNRLDDLLKNPVVSHLVNTPKDPYPDNGPFPEPHRLDHERKPEEIFCPLPADSSQLAAVLAAADGRSFVLEGPPGTGKSQTITNLIAHVLASGKTVLFVSEKMAALNVVHQRLKNIGLGTFCLELHSNKTNKAAVLGQLDEALHAGGRADEDSWNRTASGLVRHRDKLNKYVRVLHEQHTNGLSVFQATATIIGLRSTPRVALKWLSPDAIDAAALEKLRELVNQLEVAGRDCQELFSLPWRYARQDAWTPSLQQRVEESLNQLKLALDHVDIAAAACSSRLSVELPHPSTAQLDLLREIAVHLLVSPAPPLEILVRRDWEDVRSQVQTWIERGQMRDRLRSELQCRYRLEVTSLELGNMQEQMALAERSRWSMSWWRRRQVRSVLKKFTMDGRAPAVQTIMADLELAQALVRDQTALDTAGDEARTVLGRFWEDGEADWEGIGKLRDWAERLRGLVSRLTIDDFDQAEQLRERLGRIASEGHALLARDREIGRELIDFVAAAEELEAVESRLNGLLLLDLIVWGAKEEPGALTRAHEIRRVWNDTVLGLRSWCHWRKMRAEASQVGLEPIAAFYEEGGSRGYPLRSVFDHSYLNWWLSEVVEHESVLSRFSSADHSETIRQFKGCDRQMMQMASDIVRARLAAQTPNGDPGAMPNSERGILQRELQKKRKHKPVRQLLKEIPNLLPRLKPCLLMSPMSVAQYLPPDAPLFDLVVFDEASQIPVWDAVGAIARGKQAVIVGDPKQLPPTSFFERVGDDDDYGDDDIEDLESILDDCRGARLPYRTLDWHYRSRHESLIAFSNHHYYENRLLIFPSPVRNGIGVQWRAVPDGVYDRGGSRTNLGEAEAVIGEIVTRLKDPDRKCDSIGVVTFSIAQQTLIENLLDRVREGDPELDQLFERADGESVFVKNLENVQGDERDVILFSICYGPDKTGRIAMAFGPLNRDGGHRRLNVAITRARREVLVFSTLRGDQIDLSRTRARGVMDLKSFLEYAERGEMALAGAVTPGLTDSFESPFENEVCETLRRSGWTVHSQVGCAGYRIDLAVVDPRAPGRYLLGIECDGANYHRAKTARDRDALRENVLRGLGWEIHRIWSSDWWVNPDGEKERLEGTIRDLLESRPEAKESGILSASPSIDISTPLREVDVTRGPISRLRNLYTRNEPFASAPERPMEASLDVYCPLIEDFMVGEQSAFHDSSRDRQIAERIRAVVDHEGPICLELAARRVAEYWGFDRAGSKVKARIARLASEVAQVQQYKGDTIFWPKSVSPDQYRRFRTPGIMPGSERSVQEIPIEEIANAVHHLLERCVRAPRQTLVRHTARLFGCDRAGRHVVDRIESALDYLVSARRAESDGDGVRQIREKQPLLS